MNNLQLKAWRGREDLTIDKAASALGVCLNSYTNYERGFRYMGNGERREVDIPKSVALACAAISLGITSYAGEELYIN